MAGNRAKILMIGAHDSYNFGDDAIFIAILYFLEKHLGLDNNNCQIYTYWAKHSFEKLNYDSKLIIEEGTKLSEEYKAVKLKLKSFKVPKLIRFIFVNLIFIFLCINISFFRIFKKKLFFKEFITFFENLDIIHYIGGGYLTDRWLHRLMFEYFRVNIAKAINPKIRIIGTGLGIGPFKYKISLFFIKSFLNKFDYIFVRERESFNLVRKLNVKSYIKCCGDDVLLLFPLFQDLKHSQVKPSKKIIALNLKDFPDYNYLNIKSNIERLLDLLRKEKFKIKYFCFGQKPGPNDCDILRIFDLDLKRNLPIYKPYTQHFYSFIKMLSEVKFGIGCAYHFSIILSILNIPFMAIYSGDYYKQKVMGAVNFMGSPGYLLNIKNMQQLEVTKLTKKIIDLTKRNYQNQQEKKIKELYDTMLKEYVYAYRSLLGGKVV